MTQNKIIAFVLLAFIPAAIFAEDLYKPYLSLAGYQLEKSNLIEIQKELGEAPINHSGDAGDSYYGLCYILPKYNITVYFESGEMGGTNHDLLSFSVKNKKEKKLACGLLPDMSPKKLRVGPLFPGQKSESIKSKLPQPVQKMPFGLRHKNFGKRPFTQEEIERNQVNDMEYAFWDVFTQIDVYITDGKVSGYKVSRMTSW